MKSQMGLWCSWLAHKPQCTPSQHCQPFNLKYRPTHSEEDERGPRQSTRLRSSELCIDLECQVAVFTNPASKPPLEIGIVERFENLPVLVVTEAAQLL